MVQFVSNSTIQHNQIIVVQRQERPTSSFFIEARVIIIYAICSNYQNIKLVLIIFVRFEMQAQLSWMDPFKSFQLIPRENLLKIARRRDRTPAANEASNPLFRRLSGNGDIGSNMNYDEMLKQMRCSCLKVKLYINPSSGDIVDIVASSSRRYFLFYLRLWNVL